MLTGKSIYHVKQDMGKAFVPGEIRGYFNDLTQKVTFGDKNLDENGIPFLEHSNGAHVQMPTMIFQYGLGAYDLWLIEKKDFYLKKAIQCSEWAIAHQEENGAWNNFFYIYPQHPYSAMAQGEGASLLLRGYLETKDSKYLFASQKAIQYMLTDIHAGGVSVYRDGLVLLEYTHLPVVMNGWIFALFGLYDYSLLTNEGKNDLDNTIGTLLSHLDRFDCGYWSLYDEKAKICSPFYHNLHIAQMNALYQITGEDRFLKTAERWSKYQGNTICYSRAFIKKAMQKILEK